MEERRRDAHVAELVQRGFTLLPHVFSDADAAFMRARSLALYETVKDGVPYAEPPVQLGPHVFKTNMGLNVRGIGHFDRELVARMVHPDVVAVLAAALGGARFEMSSLMFSNQSRPFVKWHNHIAGFSETNGHSERGWPRFEALERITMIGYLNDLGPDTGELLLYPRAVTDVTQPPFDQEQRDWEGEVVVQAPRGTVALVDQATWHAVRPARCDDMRILIGGLFAAAATAVPEWFDRSLYEVAESHPALRALLP